MFLYGMSSALLKIPGQTCDLLGRVDLEDEGLRLFEMSGSRNPTIKRYIPEDPKPQDIFFV
jgi:hypothetical protein